MRHGLLHLTSILFLRCVKLKIVQFFVVQHISLNFEMMAYSEEAGGSTNILNIKIGYFNVL